MTTVSMDKLTKMYALEENASQLFASLSPAAKKIYKAAYPDSKLVTAETMPEMQDAFNQNTTPAPKGGGGEDIDLHDDPPEDHAAKKGGGGEDIDLDNPNPNDGSGSNVASRERLVKMVKNEAAAVLSFKALSAVERDIYLQANPVSRFAQASKKLAPARKPVVK